MFYLPKTHTLDYGCSFQSCSKSEVSDLVATRTANVRISLGITGREEIKREQKRSGRRQKEKEKPGKLPGKKSKE